MHNNEYYSRFYAQNLLKPKKPNEYKTKNIQNRKNNIFLTFFALNLASADKIKKLNDFSKKENEYFVNNIHKIFVFIHSSNIFEYSLCSHLNNG